MVIWWYIHVLIWLHQLMRSQRWVKSYGIRNVYGLGKRCANLLPDWIYGTNPAASADCPRVVYLYTVRTVYPKKYAHGFVVLCFVVVMQSFIMNSHVVFIHIHQGCFAGTGAIVRLPQCQWSKPDGYGQISQCITTTKNSKANTVCIFLGIYCICLVYRLWGKGDTDRWHWWFGTEIWIKV